MAEAGQVKDAVGSEGRGERGGEELKEQRRMLDVLKHERVDLEAEVRKLRLNKENAEQQLRQ